MNSGQSDEERTYILSEKDDEIQLREIMAHVSQCPYGPCQSTKCGPAKELILHSMCCNISGDCILCDKAWCLLILHADDCKESQCPMPRCKNLKEYLHAEVCKESECLEPYCKDLRKSLYAFRQQQLP